MPTYSYRCTECENAFDIVQAFTDDTLTVCTVCGGKLRKVFSPVGVSFTGSGFYRNDSRAKPAESAAPSSSSESSSSSSSDSSSSSPSSPTPAKKESKKDPKPASPSTKAASTSSS